MTLLHITGLRLDARVKRPGSRGGHIIGYRHGEPIYGTAKPHSAASAKSISAEERWKQSVAHHTEKDQKSHAEARSRGMRVPPAWKDVWVNPDKGADLQVKGKDVKGRVQYIYSVTARNRNAAEKFNRLKRFSKALPSMMNRIRTDLGSSDEAKVLYLISRTGFRIGGTEDTGADVAAYGAATLRGDHINVRGNTVSFDFIGKKGVRQQHTVEDPDLARIMSGAKIGQNVFNTTPTKVRSYLKSISPGGRDYLVKDFRTYVATQEALKHVNDVAEPTSKTGFRKAVLEVARRVSAVLGNTPQMARDSYIDPSVFSRWKSIGA